jgi:hypothetical protein
MMRTFITFNLLEIKLDCSSKGGCDGQDIQLAWGRRGTSRGFWWGSQKKIDNYQDLDLARRKILKSVLEKKDAVIWIGLIWLRRYQ